MQNHKLGAVVLGTAIFLFSNVYSMNAQSLEDTADNTEALIEHLLKKGEISQKRAMELKEQYGQRKIDLFLDENAVGPKSSGVGGTETPKLSPGMTESETEIVHVPPLAKEERVKGEEADLRHDLERLEKKLDRLSNEVAERDQSIEERVEAVEIKENTDILSRLEKSSWAERITWSGDLRVRYEGIFYNEDNADLLDPADPSKILNTHKDRHRGRYRARLGLMARLLDGGDANVGEVTAGFRLASGNDGNPLSTNDTFGDYQNKDNLLIDRAYINWAYVPVTPGWWKIPALSITAGRMPNPWFTATNLVWDVDLNFEGVAVKLFDDPRKSRKWSGYITLGGFGIQEEKFSSDDKWLYGAQLGTKFRPTDTLFGTIALSYCDYANIEGVVNDPERPGEFDFTAPIFQQKGNTLIDIDPTADIKTALAADYNLVNLTLRGEYTGFHPVIVSLMGDIVYNVGFDREAVTQKTDAENMSEDILGYQFGFEIGHSKIREHGQWKTAMYYRYLESDAVLDAYTDSDFHDGGTNTKGWIFSFDWGVYKNTWLAFKYLSADEIDGPSLAIDVLQVDVNVRF